MTNNYDKKGWRESVCFTISFKIQFALRKKKQDTPPTESFRDWILLFFRYVCCRKSWNNFYSTYFYIEIIFFEISFFMKKGKEKRKKNSINFLFCVSLCLHYTYFYCYHHCSHSKCWTMRRKHESKKPEQKNIQFISQNW